MEVEGGTEGAVKDRAQMEEGGRAGEGGGGPRTFYPTLDQWTDLPRCASPQLEEQTRLLSLHLNIPPFYLISYAEGLF